jgi:hypothetical protein
VFRILIWTGSGLDPDSTESANLDPDKPDKYGKINDFYVLNSGKSSFNARRLTLELGEASLRCKEKKDFRLIFNLNKIDR